MATITQTTFGVTVGEVTVTDTTLTATNTFTFTRNSGQILILRNPTGAPIAANIDGDGGTTVSVSGVGAVDVSGGYDLTVAAGATVAIKLDTIYQYLSGTIAVTGTDLVASILR